MRKAIGMPPASLAALALCAAWAAVLSSPAGGLDSAGIPRRNPLAEVYPLRFDSERIRLAIVGDSLEVRGTYVLLCREPTEAPLPLFYPFPRDSLMGGFRMVSLRFCSDASEDADDGGILARWEDLPGVSAVRWWIPPCDADTIVARAVYRQKLLAGYARYIVTTTEAWGRPLRRASFEIRLPAGAEALDFSFPFVMSSDGSGVYVYEARDFFPERDIIVRWQP